MDATSRGSRSGGGMSQNLSEIPMPTPPGVRGASRTGWPGMVLIVYPALGWSVVASTVFT